MLCLALAGIAGVAISMKPADWLGGRSASASGEKAEGQNTSDEHKKNSPERLIQSGNCYKGHVTLGTSPGAIDFSATCRGDLPVEKVGFVVIRAVSSYEHAQTGIVAFRRKPSVTGPGAIRKYGKCQRLRGKLTCSAMARGPIRLSGRLFVNSEQQCSAIIGITATVHSSDAGEGWSRPREIRILANGLPRGCNGE
jgi:hypothetical protein